MENFKIETEKNGRKYEIFVEIISATTNCVQFLVEAIGSSFEVYIVIRDIKIFEIKSCSLIIEGFNNCYHINEEIEETKSKIKSIIKNEIDRHSIAVAATEIVKIIAF